MKRESGRKVQTGNITAAKVPYSHVRLFLFFFSFIVCMHIYMYLYI